jgi:opacity protein-like surface antigen
MNESTRQRRMDLYTRPPRRRAAMSRLIAFSTIGGLIAFLIYSIPAQADEIEPEPEYEPAPITEPEPQPEPEPEPEPAPVEVDDFARSGVYLGAAVAGAAYTQLEGDLEDAFGNAVRVDVEVAAGLDTRVGYRFHPRFAGELQLQWSPDKGIGVANVSALEIESLVFTANIKNYLTTGRAQPYLLAGIGLMHFDVKDKLGLGLKAKGEGFAARFGGGMDLYFTSNVVFFLEGGYVLPTGDADGLDYASFAFGLLYRF